MANIDSGTLKKTPLNAWHHRHGAKMVDFGGWEMPVQYPPGIIQEHLATRKFGGLFDVSHMGRFSISGADRIGFLQHVLTNNAEALDPWQAQYTLIPNASGRVIDDAYLYRWGDERYLLVVNAANTDKDWAHLVEQAAAFSSVTLENHTGQLSLISFQGPLSGNILEEMMTAGRLPEPYRNRLSEITLCQTRVQVARTGYTGDPVGFELFVPAGQAEMVWSTLQRSCQARGILPVGLGARDTLRLEAGLPLYGHEFGTDPDGNQFPAFCSPLARVAVSFSKRKGDFIGRRALAAQFEQDRQIRSGHGDGLPLLPRQIKCLAVLEGGIARPGNEVYIRERKVGIVTSGTMVPFWHFKGDTPAPDITDQSDQRAIALAYVDARLASGQEVEIEVRKRRLKGRLVPWHGRSEAPPYFRPVLARYQKSIPGSGPAAVKEKVVGLLEKSLANHSWRQQECINLIPSEMTPSALVRLLQVTDPVGRYAEHKSLPAAYEQEIFYYQGTDFIAWVEEQVNREMAAYLGCPQVEARLVSGQMANMAVFGALVDYKNRLDRRREPERIGPIVNNHLGRGGHLSSQPMGALRDYVAKDPVTERYAVFNFPVCAHDPFRIDTDQTAQLLDRLDPELIIFGKSMVLYPEPIGEVKQLVATKKPAPLIMYDMAHVLGLVGPHFQEPFKQGAQIVTGSTHKTFFGTQRGIIGGNCLETDPDHEFWAAVKRRAFPGLVSNHHLGTLLGLLLAILEMEAFKDEYQPQVIANARAFARALKAAGLEVLGDPAVGYTQTHQVLVRVGYAQGRRIAGLLEQNNIIVNYQALPDDEGFTASSGLRLGVAEMTRFGMQERDFEELAGLFSQAAKGKPVKREVTDLRKKFRKLRYCFDDESLAPFKEKLFKGV